MERMRKIRARISPADSYEGAVNVGVDVYQGEGRFTGKHTIEVGGQTLRFRKAVVATGASPSIPPIKGLDTVSYHTNETLFNLTTLPPRMVLIGAGPIGMEMAQAFSLFGTDVTSLTPDFDPHVLPREDPDAREVVISSLQKDGITFIRGIKYVNISSEASSEGVFPEKITVQIENEGKQQNIECDVLLVAAGRKPNVRGIGLEEAGVKFSPRTGVAINDSLQTENPNIYAVGDCCSKYQFTHVAGTMGGMVVQNALFGGDNGKLRTMSSLAIPWVTYTHPEVAHVGKYVKDIEAQGREADTYKASFEHNDRAICDGETEGFIKIHCLKGRDEILGATCVAPCAGEIISELTLAIQAKVGLRQLGSLIHPYPTVADGIGGCAFQYKLKTWERFSKPTTINTPSNVSEVEQKHPQGYVELGENGNPTSWADPDSTRSPNDPVCGVFPMDEYNIKLLDAVHPRKWKNPSPSPDFVYDLVAIGAGAGGLVSSKQGARRGARTALIERHLSGGDCLISGCVPSKALLRCARAAKGSASLSKW
eukprot:TRINITY_DN547_c0_g1_i2.p1 TRINITY_DN547_c0_g1~~TRINITY_DN547_c0_g1_i2.p1  ORF type:complete len:538 (-),score=98.75 TRINITY_DN547_c0_g1_i2:582-2195(-)